LSKNAILRVKGTGLVTALVSILSDDFVIEILVKENLTLEREIVRKRQNEN
jgi:hypothetical protein